MKKLVKFKNYTKIITYIFILVFKNKVYYYLRIY